MSDHQMAFHGLDRVGFSVLRAHLRKASRPARRRTRRGATWQAWSLEGRELGFEALEQRIVLSNVVWNTAAAPTGGDWDTKGNWVGDAVPTASSDVTIDLTAAGSVTMTSGLNDAAASLSTNGNTTLNIVNGSLSLGVATTSTLLGPMVVSSGASFNVGMSSSIALGATLTDYGTVNFASDDTLTLGSGTYATLVDDGKLSFAPSDTVAIYTAEQIIVAGALISNSTTFFGGGPITVNPGGTITPTNSTFNVPISLPYTDLSSLTGNVSFDAITIEPGTLPSGSTLNLDAIGADTSNLSYVLDTFMVASGATLTVGPTVAVTVNNSATLTDDGTVTFASDDTLTLGSGTYATLVDDGKLSFAPSDTVAIYTAEQIIVAGALISNSTTFFGGGPITVNPGGTITPTNSTFNVPISLPYTDLSSLTGNVSFDAITIEPGTLPSGSTLNLEAIGAETSNLSYVLGPFTVASGATLTVGPSVQVTINSYTTLTDDGALWVAAGDTVTWGYDAQISVNGSLTSNGATFTGSGSSSIVVNSGGRLTANDETTFKPTNLMLNSGSNDTLSTVVFSGVLTINSGATISISGDNFSNVLNQGIIATGDPNATIDLEYDYWGTTVQSAIAAKILDHSTDSALPTVDYQPYVSDTSGTAANSASATYNPSDQTLTLSATVTDSGNIKVNEGTETFTILNGTQVVGQATTPVQVSNGAVSAQYTLPGGTALGQYVIEADYSGSGGDFLASTDTSHFLTVTPAPAAQWVIHTEPSSAATAGQPFLTQPVIYEEDQYGNLEAGDNGTIVTVSLGSGSGPIQGTTTATVVDGIATFTNLGDNTAETLTLKLSGGGLATATSSSIVVNPSAPSKLVVTQEPSSKATAGQPFTTQPVLAEEDQYDNVITSDSTHTVTAARADVGTAGLQGNDLTATFVGGVATFSGLFYDKAEAMDISFSTNAGGVSSATSKNVVVSPATASQLVIAQPPSATATAGQPFLIQPRIYEEDQFNNVETGDSTTVVTAAPNSGAGPLQGMTTSTVVGGVAMFAGLADNTAETISLKFTGGGLTSLPSSSVVVSPAAPSQFVITQEPSAAATAGQAFGTQPVVYEEDPFGNVETGDNSTVVNAAPNRGVGPLQGTTTDTVVGGVATFAGLADNTAETITLAFTGGGLTSLPSSSIVVSPAAASQLVIHTQPPANALLEQAFGTQPVIYEEDPYGNLATGDNSTVVTMALNSGAGPLQGTTTATVAGGVATFAGLADDSLGAITLKFTGGNLTPAVSRTVVVSPAVNLTVNSFTAAPDLVVAGANITYTAVVTNHGPSPATFVTLTSPLGANVSYVSAVTSQGTVGLQGSMVVIDLGTLPVGASASVRFVVTPNVPGTLTGSVNTTAAETEINTSSNSATVSTTVVDRVGTIAFSAASYAVPDNAGSATITVSRVNGARGIVTVDYKTVPINATPGVNYKPVSGTLTFPNGVTSEKVVVPVLDNPYDNHDELVSLVLSNVQTTETLGQAILGTTSTATLRIVDIDPDFNPLIVNNVQWTGTAQSITEILVTFNKPLITSTAINPANYALVNVGPDGKYGTSDDLGVAMSASLYQSSSMIVALTPAQPLPANQFFHLWINSATPGGVEDVGDNMLAGDSSTAGTSYTAMLARGTNLKYYTPAGDHVNLRITGGGIIDDLLSGSGQGIKLSVVGEVPHHTVLSGSVQKVRGGTGQAYLGATIWGLGNFGDVRVQLSSPPFQIGESPFSTGSAASTAAKPLVSLSAVGAKTSSSESLLPKPASRGKLTSVSRTMNRPFHAFH